MKFLRLIPWLQHHLTSPDNGEHLLALLLQAHKHEEDVASYSKCFRAGLAIGRKYPSIADDILGQPEWNI